MNITITEKELEAFVAEQVQSGAYKNAEELFHESLRLLQLVLKLRKGKLDALRQEIAQGAADLQQGRVTVCNTEAALDEFFDDLIRERKTTLTEKKNGNL